MRLTFNTMKGRTGERGEGREREGRERERDGERKRDRERKRKREGKIERKREKAAEYSGGGKGGLLVIESAPCCNSYWLSFIWLARL